MYETRKNSYQVRDCGTYEYEHNVLVQKMWSFELLGSLLSYMNRVHGKLMKSVRSSSGAKPSDVLNQDNSPLFPAGHLRRSCTTFVAGAPSGQCRHEGAVPMSRNEGKVVPQDHTFQSNVRHQYQFLVPLHGADISTTPLPHTT